MRSASRLVELGIEPGHTVLVTGPASLRLRGGRAECFAALLVLNEWITISELCREPILAVERCTLEVKTQPGGSWKIVNETTVPVDWLKAAHIVQGKRGVTAIVGRVDSGKSSLCTFLTNMCVRNGLKVGVIDADVGQSDIGPPTTVSSAHATSSVRSLQELKPENSFFVGDTSPSTVQDKLIRSLVRLREELADSTDLVIINTDGWITDSAAVRFKEEMMCGIRPDLVLGLGGEEIEPLFRELSSDSLRLSSSTYTHIRSKEERKSTRELGYSRFLLGSKVLKIGKEKTRLRIFDQPDQSILQWDGRFRGFLAGLLDARERLQGIGRIRDMHSASALVETTTSEQPWFLEIGNVILSSSYEEMGYGTLH